MRKIMVPAFYCHFSDVYSALCSDINVYTVLIGYRCPKLASVFIKPLKLHKGPLSLCMALIVHFVLYFFQFKIIILMLHCRKSLAAVKILVQDGLRSFYPVPGCFQTSWKHGAAPVLGESDSIRWFLAVLLHSSTKSIWWNRVKNSSKWSDHERLHLGLSQSLESEWHKKFVSLWKNKVVTSVTRYHTAQKV